MGRENVTGGYGGGHSGVVLDDCNFHECVCARARTPHASPRATQLTALPSPIPSLVPQVRQHGRL